MNTKILDNDFRKELYKNLVEAGYEKTEAQQIVGVKYFTALKEKVIETVNTIIANVNEDNFDALVESTVVTDMMADFSELQKMHKIVNA